MSKFSWEEGEIDVVDCLCELCANYNNGKRSKVCPKDLLDKIKTNKIICPVFDNQNNMGSERNLTR